MSSVDYSYVYERPDWPNLRWKADALATVLAAVRQRQGRLIGSMEALGFRLRGEANLETLTEDVAMSSQIEGEALDRDQVRSSLARRLGIDVGALTPADRHVEGVVEMTLDATQHYHVPLAEERLYGWHAALFPTGRSGMTPIQVGAWRDDKTGPIQVVSGPMGRQRVHFQAPDAARIPEEMGRFRGWFKGIGDEDPVLKAGLAHLWFVTIHPFDDGNGRIARAITDLALARSEKTESRFYSMSSEIRRERNDYYDALERAQKGTVDVTAWLQWLLGCLDRSFGGAKNVLGAILRKARFWESHATTPLNERQRLIVNRLLDGLEGKLTTSKWAALAKCSHDTALRDIHRLIERGVLTPGAAGGRSTSYYLLA